MLRLAYYRSKNLSLKKPVTYTQSLVDKSLKYLKNKNFYGSTRFPLISAICLVVPIIKQLEPATASQL